MRVAERKLARLEDDIGRRSSLMLQLDHASQSKVALCMALGRLHQNGESGQCCAHSGEHPGQGRAGRGQEELEVVQCGRLEQRAVGRKDVGLPRGLLRHRVRDVVVT